MDNLGSQGKHLTWQVMHPLCYLCRFTARLLRAAYHDVMGQGIVAHELGSGRRFIRTCRAIAVVCTLFDLAKQVNDAKRQVEANSITALNTLYNDAFLLIYNNQKNMDISLTGLESPDKLDQNEREVFSLFLFRIVSPFETAAIHYGKSTLGYETLLGYSSLPKSILAKPGGTQWLELNGDGISTDYTR